MLRAVDEGLLYLRRQTYGMFVELGRAPVSAELAEAIGLTQAGVREGWRQPHDQHALVLDPGTGEIRMANPLSAVPTAYRVQAGGRSWYANCAWDAFGICAALGTDGRIDTECRDCGEAMTIHVEAKRPDDRSVLFHCLVPASRWWEDIVFT